jgi:hypothetical protein
MRDFSMYKKLVLLFICVAGMTTTCVTKYEGTISAASVVVGVVGGLSREKVPVTLPLSLLGSCVMKMAIDRNGPPSYYWAVGYGSFGFALGRYCFYELQYSAKDSGESFLTSVRTVPNSESNSYVNARRHDLKAEGDLLTARQWATAGGAATIAGASWLACHLAWRYAHSQR